VPEARRGGAEHQAYCARVQWSAVVFKRLYHGGRSQRAGELARSAWCCTASCSRDGLLGLEGFASPINSRSKELAPVVSQPHVEVDMTRPLVSKAETQDLMAAVGFAPRAPAA